MWRIFRTVLPTTSSAGWAFCILYPTAVMSCIAESDLDRCCQGKSGAASTHLDQAVGVRVLLGPDKLAQDLGRALGNAPACRKASHAIKLEEKTPFPQPITGEMDSHRLVKAAAYGPICRRLMDLVAIIPAFNGRIKAHQIESRWTNLDALPQGAGKRQAYGLLQGPPPSPQLDAEVFNKVMEIHPVLPKIAAQWPLDKADDPRERDYFSGEKTTLWQLFGRLSCR